MDLKKAEAILLEEAKNAATCEASNGWIEKIQRLGVLVDEADTNRTIIAFIGTAILAKCTDGSIDVFALQVGDKRNKANYSARRLCKDVLAAHRPRLGLDIGVFGREPLNNQPFFGESRVSADMGFHKSAKDAVAYMIDLLNELQDLDAQHARGVLRAFLKVRKIERAEVPLPEGALSASPLQILNHLVAFISEKSESVPTRPSFVSLRFSALGYS